MKIWHFKIFIMALFHVNIFICPKKQVLSADKKLSIFSIFIAKNTWLWEAVVSKPQNPQETKGYQQKENVHNLSFDTSFEKCEEPCQNNAYWKDNK